jgi:hypothetical protein
MASPWPAIKGANVIPDWERREKAVILSGDKYACGIGGDFDGADDPVAEQPGRKDAAPASGKEMEFP